MPAVPVDVGPASFIDSERVNAVPSLELDSDPGTEDTADTAINILDKYVVLRSNTVMAVLTPGMFGNISVFLK